MSTELVNQKTGELTEVAAFTPEQTELLKRTVGKDFTNDEFLVFLNVCKKVQLDPFSKQIYGIKYGGRLTIQTSIDGLRLVADRSKNYAPGKAATYTQKADGSLESATSYVMKKVGDTWFEVSATAHIEEYMNPVNQLWKKLPHAMLAKCAESQALRRAFPNETSGLYTTEEMSQAEKGPSIQMPKEKPIEYKPGSDTGIPASGGPVADTQEIVQPEIEFPGDGPEEKEPSKFFKKLHAVAREKGLEAEKVKQAIKLLYGKESSKDLTDKECAAMITQIEKGAIRNA